MYRFLVSALIASLAIAGVATPAGAQGDAGIRSLAELQLQPGDGLNITVWNRPELSGQYKIGVEGYLLHPLYRDIRIAGVPFAQVEMQIREFLEQFQESPRFVIEPLFHVRLGGEVNGAGVHLVPPETTVATAVWSAGGPNDRGRLDRVWLNRDGRSTRLDLTDPSSPAAELYLRSGDEIIVGRRRTSILRDVIVPISTVASGLYAIARITRILDL